MQSESAGVVLPSDRAIDLQVEEKFKEQKVDQKTKELHKRALARRHVVDALKGRQTIIKKLLHRNQN